VSLSDLELVTRVVVEDDRAAFGELVLDHQSAVRAFLRQLTSGDAAWADDLAQETFVIAYKTLARFRGDSAFSSWLLGIAHNQFRNAHRRQREFPQDTLPEEPDQHEPSPADSTALRQDLGAAMAQLSTDEQTALHVCYQQGLSHSEAAVVLGWPIGTVKTHLARSKEKLRQLLAAWNPQT
jgi:RNA polymerase sigma-70 factor (ECF subfamily)